MHSFVTVDVIDPGDDDGILADEVWVLVTGPHTHPFPPFPVVHNLAVGTSGRTDISSHILDFQQVIDVEAGTREDMWSLQKIAAVHPVPVQRMAEGHTTLLRGVS